MACRTSADAGREAPRVRDEPASMEHLQMHLECAITTYKYTSMQGTVRTAGKHLDQECRSELQWEADSQPGSRGQDLDHSLHADRFSWVAKARAM
ncbi:uncharacterized protein TRIREDRAFT_103614 [Trichoderma reesei QM6a]|uniref:Predicted protein n=2 Tax=Hypocrea jecorina TaxID=51453 RepID=G0RAX2_HYPJQ|nr:uncharacterized protein TRIREDRAFT_103614 [Trichoderma reesei QM6a]EGR51675.1 predicted protein [Trichoderma reesei QM6a]ETS05503.1 hypothetical protein M419DRAFT_127060 [Trichoderma reesei RUT C-30]